MISVNNIIVGIVTFNRNKCVIDLIKKIKSFYKYINFIIFDNSSSNIFFNKFKNDFILLRSNVKNSYNEFLNYSSIDREILKIEIKNKNLYIQNSENIGGAGGIGAIQYIFSKFINKNFLWLIDDEVEINKNTLKELLNFIKINKKIGIVGSVILEENNLIKEAGCLLNKRDFEFIPLFNGKKAFFLKKVNINKFDYVSFSSVLIKKEVIKKIGIFKNFFIHVDDAEYCLRAKKNGFKVEIAKKSFIKNKIVKKGIYSIYDLRNYLFLAFEYFSLRDRFFLILNLLKKFIYSLFYNKKAFEVIKSSFFLFLFKRFGKIR